MESLQKINQLGTVIRWNKINKGLSIHQNRENYMDSYMCQLTYLQAFHFKKSISSSICRGLFTHLPYWGTVLWMQSNNNSHPSKPIILFLELSIYMQQTQSINLQIYKYLYIHIFHFCYGTNSCSVSLWILTRNLESP